MRHQDLTKNHILESWVYANAAARTSASGFVTADVGRIAYQTDTGQYWRLTSTAPTWAIIDIAHQHDESLPANPAGTISTGGLMMGLGGSSAYTPVKTGKVLVIFTGLIANSFASGTSKPQIRYGTGAAPANGAALTGTAVGNAPVMTNNANTAGLRSGFTCMAVISGLTLGTPYWFDLSLAASAGPTTATLYEVCAEVIEL